MCKKIGDGNFSNLHGIWLISGVGGAGDGVSLEQLALLVILWVYCRGWVTSSVLNLCMKLTVKISIDTIQFGYIKIIQLLPYFFSVTCEMCFGNC